MTRKSRREIERAIERTTENSDYTTPPLAVVLSAETVEAVDGRPDLVHLDGDVYRRPGDGLLNELIDEAVQGVL